MLLRRSQEVRTHQGTWAAVSGSIEAASPLDQAVQEMREETGREADGFRLARRGRPLDVGDTEHGVQWLVHPFLFSIMDPSLVRPN